MLRRVRNCRFIIIIIIRQHVTAVSLNKQYTNVQKVDSQAEPTFETRLVTFVFKVWQPSFKSDPRLVFKAQPLFKARLVFKDLR